MSHLYQLQSVTLSASNLGDNELRQSRQRTQNEGTNISRQRHKSLRISQSCTHPLRLLLCVFRAEIQHGHLSSTGVSSTGSPGLMSYVHHRDQGVCLPRIFEKELGSNSCRPDAFRLLQDPVHLPQQHVMPKSMEDMSTDSQKWIAG